MAHLCAAWLPAASGGGKAAAAAAPTVLAVGTASGDVTAYDTATAEVRWRALSVNDGGVSCLAASAAAPGQGKRAAAASSSPARLVSCGADAVVASLDPATGEPAPFCASSSQHQHGAANGHAHHTAAATTFRGSKHPVTALALSSDGGRALVGATTLAVWELSSSNKPRRLAKLTGHPLPVRAAAFAPGPGHYALTAARGERGVSVWRASAAALQQQQGSSKKSKAAAAEGEQRGSVVVAASANLPMDDEAVQLATCAGGGGGDDDAAAFFAAAVGEGGECIVWRVSPGASSSSSLEVVPQARVRVAGAAAGGEMILAAHLEPTAGEGERAFFFVAARAPQGASDRPSPPNPPTKTR